MIYNVSVYTCICTYTVMYVLYRIRLILNIVNYNLKTRVCTINAIQQVVKMRTSKLYKCCNTVITKMILVNIALHSVLCILQAKSVYQSIPAHADECSLFQKQIRHKFGVLLDSVLDVYFIYLKTKENTVKFENELCNLLLTYTRILIRVKHLVS